jgi:hypothetical protein
MVGVEAVLIPVLLLESELCHRHWSGLRWELENQERLQLTRLMLQVITLRVRLLY